MSQSVLKDFYAVTKKGSVYQANILPKDKHEDGIVLRKIGKQGRQLVDTKLFRSPMLAIARRLICFIPEGGGITSFQREVADVNIAYWTYYTNDVVALFLDKKPAFKCSSAQSLFFFDPRWRISTVATLQAVGQEHLRCSISIRAPNLWLMPPDSWLRATV